MEDSIEDYSDHEVEQQPWEAPRAGMAQHGEEGELLEFVPAEDSGRCFDVDDPSPGSPEGAFAAAARMRSADDGTIVVLEGEQDGQALVDDEAHFDEVGELRPHVSLEHSVPPAAPEPASHAAPPAPVAEDSDGDGEGDGEAPLAEEPWMYLPEAERELWERLRPRALRREAAQLRALKLPAASLGRLMRLHPHLPMKSAEAVEIINYATVLLMQAVVRAAAREKGTGRARIQYSDIRKACVGVRELQFMCPLECTLDASALVMRSEPAAAAAPAAGPDAQAPGFAGAPQAGISAARVADGGRRATPGGRRAAVLATGQRRLTAGVFARSTATTAAAAAEDAANDGAAAGEALDDQGSESGGEVTPNVEDRSAGVKRSAPPSSAQKVPSKAPRRASAPTTAAAGTAAGLGLAAFFRRTEAARG